MFGTLFAAVVSLVLAGTGVAALAWLLWRLWVRREEETPKPAIEVKAEVPAPEVEAPDVEVEAEAPAPEVEVPDVEVEAKAPEPEVEAPDVRMEEVPVAVGEPDDLKRIEGIGPKLSSVLQAAGITTFSDLADTDVDRLRQILEEADPRLLRLADPTTWPEQAGLAADGQWEALQALQDELKGSARA